MKEKTLSDIICQFSAYLLGIRRYSKHTADAYFLDVQHLLKFLIGAEYKTATPLQISNFTLHDFRSWLVQRKKEIFNPSSNARAIAAIKSFFRFAKNYKIATNDNVFKLTNPKIGQSVPKSVSYENIVQILQNLPSNDWVAKRNKAILTMLYACGLRISECLSIQKHEFFNSNDSIRILGKGGKERIIPMIKEVLPFVQEYLKIAPQELLEKSEFLFIGQRTAKCNARNIQKLLENIRLQYNLPNHLTPHSLRHSFATHIISNGGSIRNVQDLLRHSSLNTTQRYVNYNTSAMIETYQKHFLAQNNQPK